MTEAAEPATQEPIEEGHETPMEIHKPKPWHGLREFLKEYLIISVGVLTALAAEQAVEALHWRHVVAEEREILAHQSETQEYAMSARLQLEPCITRRLVELEALFSRHRRGAPLGKLGPVGRPGYILGGAQGWELAVADQSISHMSTEEKDLYAAMAENWRSYEATRLEERAAWMKLQALNHPEDLSPTDWSALRQVLEEARDTHQLLSALVSEDGYLRGFRALHLPRPRMDPKWLTVRTNAVLCQPMLDPAAAGKGA